MPPIRQSRRRFLAAAASTGAAFGLGSTFWQSAFAAPATPGAGPYGPLQAANADGLLLPVGFTSRVVARTGQAVAPTTYVWPPAPDGAATFPTTDGGWIYTVNSETLSVLGGGASALRFDSTGAITSATRILAGTNANCAGGLTPWGTWLSCEEYDLVLATGPVVPGFPFGPGVAGQVWECDPTGAVPGVPLPALGKFSHEAAAVDPATNIVYLTEDQGDGFFYRFRPDTPNVGAKADLSSGVLEAAVVADPSALPAGTSAVSWIAVRDPGADPVPTRQQVAATAFRRGEGAWFDGGVVYFTTTSDDRVWAYATTSAELSVVADLATAGGPLEEPDNITVHPSTGDLYVAEDDDNLELVLITAPDAAGSRTSSPFLRITGQSGTEVSGPTFDPTGNRLYLSSQRGLDANRGITYEISGPFLGGGPDPEIPEVPWAMALPLSAAAIAAGAYVVHHRQADRGATLEV